MFDPNAAAFNMVKNLMIGVISHNESRKCSYYLIYNYLYFLPKTVIQVEILKVGEKLYIKEYYDEFCMLKIGNGIQKINITNTTENSQHIINVTTFEIPLNTFFTISKSGRLLKSYIDHNDACDLIVSLDIYKYDVYISGFLFNNVPLEITENAILEIFKSNPITGYLEDSSKIDGIKCSYQIKMSHANLTVNVSKPSKHAGNYQLNTVIIFDIDNPEKDINLNVHTIDEGIIIQTSFGVTFNSTKHLINGSIIPESIFYRRHVIAIIEIWISEDNTYQFTLPKDFYIHIQRQFKNCDRCV
ncbi:unnamed protein product [Gordionus sp. m RMFG-2023]